MKKYRLPRFIREMFTRRTYYAIILIAGQTIRIPIEAPDHRRALLEAEAIADGGELLDCAEA